MFRSAVAGSREPRAVFDREQCWKILYLLDATFGARQ
jgi:hypothetical protein